MGIFLRNFEVEKTIINVISDNISEIMRMQKIFGIIPATPVDYFWRDILLTLVCIIVVGVLIMYLLRDLKIIKCNWFFSLNRGRE